MNEEPQKKWNDLKDRIAVEIKSIDVETQWQEKEPKWWLEMMQIERALIAIKTQVIHTK
jgi:hypothetical protein